MDCSKLLTDCNGIFAFNLVTFVKHNLSRRCGRNNTGLPRDTLHSLTNPLLGKTVTFSNT